MRLFGGAALFPHLVFFEAALPCLLCDPFFCRRDTCKHHDFWRFGLDTVLMILLRVAACPYFASFKFLNMPEKFRAVFGCQSWFFHKGNFPFRRLVLFTPFYFCNRLFGFRLDLIEHRGLDSRQSTCNIFVEVFSDTAVFVRCVN